MSLKISAEAQNTSWNQPPPFEDANRSILTSQPADSSWIQPPQLEESFSNRSIPTHKIHLLSSGHKGSDARNGINGASGRDGSSAGQAIPGQAGSAVVLTLESSSPTHVMVTGHSATTGPLNENHDVNSIAEIVLTSIGGDGGHGGTGGNGLKGYTGSAGRDATRHSNGGDGGTGGPGGDGGAGSDGQAGGQGGTLQVNLSFEELYLLMLVKGWQRPDDLAKYIAGGVGGHRGSHGQGGSGGDGGRGGSSYSWTTTSRDSDGNTVTHHHSNPGGRSGSRGRSGRTPSFPLHDGKPGEVGRADICVKVDGNFQAYKFAYHFSVTAFDIFEEGNGIFEFGEILRMGNIGIVNDGGMPSPLQRCQISANPGYLIRPFVSDVFTSPGAKVPGETPPVGGFVNVRLGYEDTNHSIKFEPLVKKTTMDLRIDQLGNEDQYYHGENTVFKKSFEDFNNKKTDITVQFPVEIKEGIKCFTSLHPGMKTRISVTLTNVSTVPLGRADNRLLVADLVANAGGNLKNFTFYEEAGQEVHILQNVAGSLPQGYHRPLDVLPYNTTIHKGELLLNPDVGLYTSCVIHAASYIQGKEDPNQLTVMQRTAVPVRVEPIWKPRKDAQVILVLNHNTTHEIYSKWMSLLEGELGLQVDIYPITVYGHFDPDEKIEGTCLRDVFYNRLVIVMDDLIEMPGHKGCFAVSSFFSCEMMNSFQKDLNVNPRFFFVQSSAVPAPKHLFRAPALNDPTHITHDSIKKFLTFEKERFESFKKTDEEFALPNADLLDFIHITTKETKKGHVEYTKKLKKKAEKLKKKLRKSIPQVHHTLVYRQFDSKPNDEKNRLIIGAIEVRCRYSLRVADDIATFAVCKDQNQQPHHESPRPVPFSQDSRIPTAVSAETSGLQRLHPLCPDQLYNWNMLLSLAHSFIPFEKVKLLQRLLLRKLTDHSKLMANAFCASIVTDIAREAVFVIECDYINLPHTIGGNHMKFLTKYVPSLTLLMDLPNELFESNNQILTMIYICLSGLATWNEYTSMLSRSKKIMSIIIGKLESHFFKKCVLDKKDKDFKQSVKNLEKMVERCFIFVHESQTKNKKNAEVTPLQFFENDNLEAVFLTFPKEHEEWEKEYKESFISDYEKLFTRTPYQIQTDPVGNVCEKLFEYNKNLKVHSRQNNDVRFFSKSIFSAAEWEDWVAKEQRRKVTLDLIKRNVQASRSENLIM